MPSNIQYKGDDPVWARAVDQKLQEQDEKLNRILAILGSK